MSEGEFSPDSLESIMVDSIIDEMEKNLAPEPIPDIVVNERLGRGIGWTIIRWIIPLNDGSFVGAAYLAAMSETPRSDFDRRPQK